MSEPSSLLSNEQIIDVFALTKIATAIHVTEDAIIQTATDAMLKIWGKDRSVIGKSLEDALPELKGQPFIDLFKKVWREGLTISGTDTAADLIIDGILTTFYFDFEYRAIKDSEGNTLCILHTAIDVTDRFLKREAIERAKEKEAALEREQALNEELAAANEELNAINEELQQAQESLLLLNTELEDRVYRRTKAIEESESRFRTMAEAAGILIAVGDETSNAVYFNHAWTELTGKSMEYLLQFGWAELIHPDDKDRYVDIYLSAFEKRVPFTGEFRIRSKDGDYRWLLAKGPPRFRQDGTFAGYISSCTDITESMNERNRHETELRDINDELAAAIEEQTSVNEELNLVNEKLLETYDELLVANSQLEESESLKNIAIDQAKLGIWYVDVATKAFAASPRFKDFFGYHADETVLYEDAMARIRDDYKETMIDALDAAINDGKDFDLIYPVIGFHDQKLRWVRAIGRLNTTKNGGLPYLAGTIMDITEEKKDEQRKNDFIGMVSHELKTPLTSLNGYIQILQKKAKRVDDTFTEGALEIASTQVKKMTSMINGFLNISRLESGKIVLNKSIFRLDKLLEATVEETRLLGSSHELTCITDGPIEIFADLDKIDNVISNLLSNAVKYAPNHPKITVNCGIVNGMAQISVKDEGMGIKAEDLQHLFERYYRVESNNTISGFGIGLYLSAEIVERHNGQIWVESIPGEGSTFYFSIPLA